MKDALKYVLINYLTAELKVPFEINAAFKINVVGFFFLFPLSLSWILSTYAHLVCLFFLFFQQFKHQETQNEHKFLEELDAASFRVRKGHKNVSFFFSPSLHKLKLFYSIFKF